MDSPASLFITTIDTEDGRLMLNPGGNKFSFAESGWNMFNQTTNLPTDSQSIFRNCSLTGAE